MRKVIKGATFLTLISFFALASCVKATAQRSECSIFPLKQFSSTDSEGVSISNFQDFVRNAKDPDFDKLSQTIDQKKFILPVYLQESDDPISVSMAGISAIPTQNHSQENIRILTGCQIDSCINESFIIFDNKRNEAVSFGIIDTSGAHVGDSVVISNAPFEIVEIYVSVWLKKLSERRDEVGPELREIAFCLMS